jgi:phospholipase/carboxylesterase
MREETIELAGLRAVAVGDPEAAQMVVVLLHGFAMVPGDLSPFAHSLGLPAWFLFPEGPLAAEPSGRAFWHIDPVLRAQALARGPRDFAVQHPPDLPAARARLTALLDALAPRVGGRPLFVGGFSQGGMLTCDTLVRERRAVDGVVLLSASRIAFDEWPPFLEAGNLRGLPVFVSHGSADEDLAFAAGVSLCDCLRAAGAEVTWVPFDQGHQIPLLVWRRLRKFLLGLMAARGAGASRGGC